MIRVLHIVGIMNQGGIENFLMNMYREIDRSQIQFDFLVTREEVGLFDDEIRSLGGHIYNIPHIKKVGKKKHKEAFIKVLQQSNYKIVHCHMSTWCWLYLPIARENNVPTRIAHSHVSHIKLGNLQKIFEYFCKLYTTMTVGKYATNYFACGDQAGKYLYGKKLYHDKVKVINNAINTEKFKYRKDISADLRKELNISEDTFVVGHVGRFSYAKNHSYLIDIFREINNKHSNSLLLLVGDGENKKNIQEKVNQLGLNDSVRFLGLRNDTNELMMVFDVFLFPSLYEGFPVTMVEAQASGLNCIVSNSISHEVDMGMGLVTFVELEQSSQQWANTVLKNRTSNRTISINKLIELGYDSKTVANWLQKFYANSNSVLH